MSTIKKYVIKSADGEVIDTGFERLADAVLSAARWDGYGAEFKRDKDGLMRLYSSSCHIGNNAYHPKDKDAFYPGSGQTDDDSAKNQVAIEVWARGVLHSNLKLEIIAIEWTDGAISKIDGERVDEYIKRAYEGLDEDEMPDRSSILKQYT